MPKYQVREEGEFEWWECDAYSLSDAAKQYAAFDYCECDGWERDRDYIVVVQGPLTGDVREYRIAREFEPQFYAYEVTGPKTDMED